MKQIMITTKDKFPYRFEQTYDVQEWLEDRQRLCNAAGYTTELDNQMLFVYDGDSLKCIYSEETEEEEFNIDHEHI